MVPVSFTNTNMQGEIILYQSDSQNITASVLFKDETFWMTQKDIAELFHVDLSTINYHLKSIYESNELNQASTIGIFPIVRKEGSRNVTRNISFYNLDVIIAVGYRVNSKEATKFRIWATNTLREYIIKGFVLNDEMLKNGRPFGKDYFDDLLERIREIRASERRFYQKITDIFAQCSYDYDKNSPSAKEFYATVQNKLHWAISNKTAAELIAERANHNNLIWG